MDGCRVARVSAAPLPSRFVIVMGGCSDDLATRPGGTGDPGFTARVVLTRQRDLVDRGLVNVFTRNDTGQDVIVHSRGLVLSAFAAPVPVQRRSPIGAGSEVALQIAYGEVVDCDSAAPVTGTVEIEYTTAADGAVRSASVPLADATVLDDIRADVCADRLVHSVSDVSLEDPAREGETVTATLVIDRHEGGGDLEIRSLGGTVLFGVRAAEVAAIPLDLGADEGSWTVPLVISVNRCDPHALAETTKRYAVDLRVSIDGAEPRKVGLDVDGLVPLLEQALEACRVRNGDA